jgi:hypothetical protein
MRLIYWWRNVFTQERRTTPFLTLNTFVSLVICVFAANMYNMRFFACTGPIFHLLSGLASADSDGIGGIDPRDTWEEMEHILVDNSGTNSDGFVK